MNVGPPEYASREKRSEAGIAPDAAEALKRHPWPGNVRELENTVQRALALSKDGFITPLDLPKERNQVRQTKPENISISVNRDGDIFWGLTRITDNEDLVRRLKEKSVLNPQPEVHIRGDLRARYESIGRVVFGCQRAGIVKVNFIIEPPVATAGG